jgi:two-component system sensor histidine kinase RegB
MRTLLPELRREHARDVPLEEDLALLQEQVDRCRTILREMVAFGQAQLSQEVERVPLQDFVHGCLERFQLLRPEAELALDLHASTAGRMLRVPPGLRHALINLLNNAADASASRGSDAVELDIRCEGGWLELSVRDHGPGFDAQGTVALGRTAKQGGLGLGLALAEATAERLDGELTASNTGHGAQVRLRLPLAVIGAD